VTCDLIDTKNSTVIILGTCFVNVLGQLWVKYYIVKCKCIRSVVGKILHS
jgi:hypothetical protein